MRFKQLWRHRVLSGLLGLVILYCPWVLVARGGTEDAPAKPTSPPVAAKPQPASAPEAAKPGPATVLAAKQAAPAADSQRVHSVYLRVDGILFGRVSVIDATGAFRPVKARISFVQAGEEVAAAQSDEWGHFRAVGLQPGVYSVIATGSDAFGAFSVRILPYDKAADQ
ncbi:unnamed protein product, partial [marine sediment metagenome]